MQIVELLPDHLAESVLRAVPPAASTAGPAQASVLAHLLHILPPPLHHLALRARCPSLVASGALTLPPLPPQPGTHATPAAAALRAAAAVGGVTQLCIDGARMDIALWAAELPALRTLRVLRVRAARLDGLSMHVAALTELQCMHLLGSFGDPTELARIMMRLRDLGGVTDLTLDLDHAGEPMKGSAVATGDGCRGVWSPRRWRGSTQHASAPALLRRHSSAGKHTLSRAARAQHASQRAARMQKAAGAPGPADVAAPRCARSLHAQPPAPQPEGAAAALAALPGLTRLSVHSRVGGGGCEHLAAAIGQLSALRDLRLGGLRFGPQGAGADFRGLAASIGGLRELTALRLRGVNVDPGGSDGVAEGEQQCGCRAGLSLRGVHMARSWAALGAALRGLLRLQTLRLRHCNVCECGLRSVAAAAAAAPALHSLELCVGTLPLHSAVGVLGVLGLRGGSAEGGLRWLRLGAGMPQAAPWYDAEGPRLSAALAPLTGLTHLALDAGGLSGAAAEGVLRRLAALPVLEELHLVGCALHPCAMAALAPRFCALRRMANFRISNVAGVPVGQWVDVWERPSSEEAMHAAHA